MTNIDAYLLDASYHGSGRWIMMKCVGHGGCHRYVIIFAARVYNFWQPLNTFSKKVQDVGYFHSELGNSELTFLPDIQDVQSWRGVGVMSQKSNILSSASLKIQRRPCLQSFQNIFLCNLTANGWSATGI